MIALFTAMLFLVALPAQAPAQISVVPNVSWVPDSADEVGISLFASVRQVRAGEIAPAVVTLSGGVAAGTATVGTGVAGTACFYPIINSALGCPTG